MFGPGEGGLDFQKEILLVPETVGLALDHLDPVVHTFQQAGVHGKARTGEEAPGIVLEVAGKALQGRQATLPCMAQPGSSAQPVLPHAGGVLDLL